MSRARAVKFGNRTKEASIFYQSGSTGAPCPLGGSIALLRGEPERVAKERKKCEITDSLLLPHRAKVFRGKKVLGDYDIKVEQVPLGFYCVAYGFVESGHPCSF